MKRTEEAIAEYDGELAIKQVIPDKQPKVGYNTALVLLAIAAFIAIFIKF